MGLSKEDREKAFHETYVWIDNPDSPLRRAVRYVRVNAETVVNAGLAAYDTVEKTAHEYGAVARKFADENKQAVDLSGQAAAGIAAGLGVRFLLRSWSPRLQLFGAMLGTAGAIAAMHPEESKKRFAEVSKLASEAYGKWGGSLQIPKVGGEKKQ